MKKDFFNTLERTDFELDVDWEFKYDLRCLEFPIEIKFDIDRKFGLNSGNSKDFQMHLYAEYNPVEGTTKLKYYIDTDNDYYVGTYEPNETERDMLIREMEKAVMLRERMRGRAFYLSEYFQGGRGNTFELYCDDTQDEIRLVNRNDGFVVLCEEDVILEDYINDDIICTFYDNSSDFVIKSADTDDIIYDSRNDHVSQQEINKILQPDDQNRWQTLLANAVCYIGESEAGEDLYDTLHNVIGMTNEEIEKLKFTSLAEYFEEVEEQGGMTMQ